MSLELEVDGTERPVGTWSRQGDEAPHAGRPNVSGDLSTLFRAAPLFGRAVAGYDRFQVDTYVRWAEEELAIAEREREHLLTRQVRTRAELDDARRLLTHSPAGGELLQVSGRIGSMLAAAADEADGIRADARAELATATAEAQQLLARADETVTAAQAGARRLVAEATTAATVVTDEAGRVLAEAETTRREATAEAAAVREEARRVEQRAVEHAGRVREEAAQDAAATLLRARAEVVGMLATGRELRRRADEEAAAVRDELDRTAAARRAGLLAEVDQLERHRAALLQEVERLAGVREPAPEPPSRPFRRVLEGLRHGTGPLATP